VFIQFLRRFQALDNNIYSSCRKILRSHHVLKVDAMHSIALSSSACRVLGVVGRRVPLLGVELGGFRSPRRLVAGDSKRLVVNRAPTIWSGLVVPLGFANGRFLARCCLCLALSLFVVCVTRADEISTATSKTKKKASKAANRSCFLHFVVAFRVGGVLEALFLHISTNIEFHVALIVRHGPHATRVFVALVPRKIFAFNLTIRGVINSIATWDSVFVFKNATHVCIAQTLHAFSGTHFLIFLRAVHDGFRRRKGHPALRHSTLHTRASLIRWKSIWTPSLIRWKSIWTPTCVWWIASLISSRLRPII